jgi:hypothetical protein
MIKEKTIMDIAKRVEGLLRQYQSPINGVFENEGKIKINMPVELSYDRTMKGTKVKVGIVFVTDKIDDSSTGYVNEEQGMMKLESVAPDVGSGELKKCPLRPDDLIYASYCNIFCLLRRETILVNGVEMPFVAENCDGLPDDVMLQFRSCSAWADQDTKANVERMLELCDLHKEGNEDEKTAKILEFPGTAAEVPVANVVNDPTSLAAAEICDGGGVESVVADAQGSHHKGNRRKK